jgi:thiol-disulfide isomerase/thioredoxin
MIGRISGILAVAVLILAPSVYTEGTHLQLGKKPDQLVILNVLAPEIVSSASDLLNTKRKSFVFSRGQVYVLHFWTFGCINCQHNQPAYAKWQKKYVEDPLMIIGIHTPETQDERDRQRVIEEIGKQSITYPVVLDNQTLNWTRWKQRWWPTVYLIDKRGHVRYYWRGELEWENAGGTRIMEEYIDQLLQEPGPESTGARDRAPVQ